MSCRGFNPFGFLSWGLDPSFGPRCRLFKIGPKAGAPWTPLLRGHLINCPLPFQNSCIRPCGSSWILFCRFLSSDILSWYHFPYCQQTYSETVIPRLTKAAHDVTNAPVDELMDMFGTAFVSYVSQYGYDRVMRVLGRNLRDFLNGLDNLHEYLRFSYPKLKPPSFFCENETRKGLTLHYRSKRKGFVYYVMGQIAQVSVLG